MFYAMPVGVGGSTSSDWSSAAASKTGTLPEQVVISPEQVVPLVTLSQPFSTADFLQLNQIYTGSAHPVPASSVGESVMAMTNQSGHPINIHGPGGVNGRISSPWGDTDVLGPYNSGLNRNPLVGIIQGNDSQGSPVNPDGSVNVYSPSGAGVVGKVMPDGTYVPIPNAESARRGEYLGKLGEETGEGAAQGDGQSEFSSLAHDASHVASKVFHAVTGFADSAGSAVSNHVAAATGLGAAGVVVGCVVTGVIDVGGLAAGVAAVF
jgi:hypothetical protein